MAESARAPVPFLGRVEAVEALHERLQEARSGRGGVTLLVGDTGVGKSTLLAELCQEIRGHGMRALVGRAPAVDEPPPFALVDDAIASRHDDPSVRAEEAPTMGGGSYLIGFAPHLQETSAPAPLGIEERLLELLGASDRRGKMSQDEILHHIAEPFLELTRHGPTAILLDDLDRADASSLDAVEFFATELQFRPMWILATSRSLGSLSEAGRARIEAFERRTGAARVHLPPMTTAEAAEFLRAIDPNRAISQEELERRFSESGGNPLLLQQMDRRRRSGSEETGGPGPDLPSLGEPAQEALDVASVLGPEFPFGWLLRASGTEEEPLTEAVEELVSSGVLFERPGEILEFPQERVRQAAYDAVSEVRRRRFHRRAGEALEEMGRGDANRTFALARLF
ncbi:MAG: ATP-binding protein [Thermoplasmata archaeon]|nr:ATP-binding protein [Thermoplasmata archaeon]